MKVVNKTKWIDKRLQRLFDRYDLLYFSGKFRDYQVIIDTLPGGTFGTCDWSKRTITIDAEHHKSDRELRGTVLHEMVHPAVRKPRHGVHFFAQIEGLLQKRA